MADSNLKRGEPRHFEDNDPFAELTRIMARDSRSEADAAAADDAFGIDLEKEMLGGIEDPFGDFDPEADLEASTPAYERAAPAISEPAISKDAPVAGAEDELSPEALDDAFAADFDEAGWRPADSAPAQPAASADEWERAPVFPASAPAATAPVLDHSLADVDMDFGDLDFSEDDGAAEFDEAADAEASAYVPTAQAAVAEPAAWQPEEPHDLSLEDELGMLLSDRQPAVAQEESGEQDGDEAGGSVGSDNLPHIPLYGRANYSPPHEAGEIEAAEQEQDRWTDEPDWDQPSVENWQKPVAAQGEEAPEEIAESVSLEAAQPVADPFAIFSTIAPGAPQPQQPSAPVSRHFDVVDELDTVEVPEAAVALHDDLDLPQVEDDRPATAYDDFDAEFSNSFGSVGGDAQPAPETEAEDDDAAKLADEDFFAEALGLSAATAGTAAAARAATSWQDAGHGYGVYAGDANRADAADLEDEIDVATYGTAAVPAARRRTGMYVAGGVLALAVLGGVSVFALSFGGGDADEAPVLVQADSEPLKVKPENPGGTKVPNQESRAYERVAGTAGDNAAAQERLVSTTEEPVDLAARAEPENVLPGVDEDMTAIDTGENAVTAKSEDRIETPKQEEVSGVGVMEDLAAVQPRKVRTMIVRPDGTLVPREEPAQPAAASLAPVETPAATATGPLQPIATAVAEPAANAIREVSLLPVQPAAQTAPQVQQPPAAVATDVVTPQAGPIVPQRPAEQPAQAAPQPRQQQVAQAAAPARTEPAAPQAAASEWSMQIASAPSAEGAQATYQDLARRYGSIIGSQGVNIVRAEIPGKGTYYRVRIPSTSRAEAISLCEKYKGAGGSCFVSK